MRVIHKPYRGPRGGGEGRDGRTSEDAVKIPVHIKKVLTSLRTSFGINYPIIVIIPKMLNFGYKSIFVSSLFCSCSPNGRLETKNTFALYDFYLFGKVMLSSRIFRTLNYTYVNCVQSQLILQHSTPFISSYIPRAVSKEVGDSNVININRNCLQTVRGKHKKN